MVTAIAISGIWFADPSSPWWMYILTAVVAVTYIGIAMIHNDILDLEIDKINAPQRPIPSNKISIKQATIYAIILFIVGTSAGALLRFQAIIIMVITLIVSLLYNAKLKKTGFIGNLAVGFTATSAFLYGDAVAMGFANFWPVSNWNASIYLFLISAVLNTSREVTKGIMDVEGDKEYGVHTIAVRYGKKSAAILVSGLLLFALLLAIYPVVINTFGYIFIIAIIGFLLLMLRAGIPLLKEPNYDNAKKFKTQLLPNMFLALVMTIIDILLL
jgi:geranylgeranylglycerol-phosphate geranylgeranyltransferase